MDTSIHIFGLHKARTAHTHTCSHTYVHVLTYIYIHISIHIFAYIMYLYVQYFQHAQNTHSTPAHVLTPASIRSETHR